MLHNDNVISTSVSEAVEKIPADEKDYHKCSFIVEIVAYLLVYIQYSEKNHRRHFT